MGKGSKSAPTEQTITQTNIPDEFKPFFERMLGRSEAQSLQPYQTYGGPRLAASDRFADIGASQTATRNLATGGNPLLSEAQGMTRGVAQGAAGLAALQQPYQFSQYGGFQAQQPQPFSDFSASKFGEFNYGPAGQFTGSAVGQYMDPYMQNVVDVQKRRAQEDFDIARGGRNTRAVQAGAFGGSRQAVQEGMAERALLEQKGDIQAQGLSSAYGDAQRMFEQDRAARMATEQARAAEAARVQGGVAGEAARVQQARADELARTQGIGVSEAGRVQQAQAAELARTQGGQAAENLASRQFGLEALQMQGGQAQQLAGLSEQERAAQIQNAQLLEAIGRAQQGETQAGLDIGYQDFLRQTGQPQEQLGFYSDVLRGLPVANVGTQDTQGFQSYNPGQQALGAGLSALSLYRAFQ